MGDVTIATPRGGMPGYLSSPGGDGPWPGVVVLHDGFGIGQAVREQADWLAGAGYIVVCRVAGGISAPGPHRSGREPLDSSGSCRPVIDGAFCGLASGAASPLPVGRVSPRPPLSLGLVPQLPVREQIRVPRTDPLQPCPRLSVATLEPLVLPASPPHQLMIDAFAQWDHRGRVEHGEIREPPATTGLISAARSFRVSAGAPVQSLVVHSSAELRDLFPGSRRLEARERHLPFLVPGLPGTERVGQERERGIFVLARPVAVLTVDYLCLAGMDFQPDIG